MRKFAYVLLSILVVMAIAAPIAIADSAQPNLALSPGQTWTFLLGWITPLFTYLLNHYAPWVSEPVKAVVHVVVAGVVGALYKLASTGGIDFTHAATWQYIGTAVLGALIAHKILYAPGQINTLFKGGSNQDRRHRR